MTSVACGEFFTCNPDGYQEPIAITMSTSSSNRLQRAIESTHQYGSNLLRILSISRRIKETKYAKQRITRGWDDRATWSLDTHLCATLGEQLAHLAEMTHGYPAGSRYTTFDQWQDDLRLYGKALTEYAEHKFSDDETIDQGRLEMQAQEALRWVADNLGSLWD